MHHRRARTSRREGRRIENKKVRAAERTVLEGGRARKVLVDRWGYRPEQPPIVYDEQQRVRSGSVSRSKPKQTVRCPSRPDGRKHQFLSDTEYAYETRYEYVGWDGRPRRLQYYWWREDGELKPVQQKVERTYKLCVHCGLEIQLRKKDVD